MFAELAIHSLFRSDGWSCRWVETYAARKSQPYFFSGWDDRKLNEQTTDQLPQNHDWTVLDRIKEHREGISGFWDIMAWKRQCIVFAEAKNSGKDKIRGTQSAWLEAALEAGVDSDNFLIVEWKYNNG